jgi:hypothetical protein
LGFTDAVVPVLAQVTLPAPPNVIMVTTNAPITEIRAFIQISLRRDELSALRDCREINVSPQRQPLASGRARDIPRDLA